MTSPRRNNAAGGLAQGTQPTAAEAASIVLASCAPEFPSATLANTMGYLYPLQDARSIFSDRVVDNCSSGGFKMPPAKIRSVTATHWATSPTPFRGMRLLRRMRLPGCARAALPRWAGLCLLLPGLAFGQGYVLGPPSAGSGVGQLQIGITQKSDGMPPPFSSISKKEFWRVTVYRPPALVAFSYPTWSLLTKMRCRLRIYSRNLGIVVLSTSATYSLDANLNQLVVEVTFLGGPAILTALFLRTARPGFRASLPPPAPRSRQIRRPLIPPRPAAAAHRLRPPPTAASTTSTASAASGYLRWEATRSTRLILISFLPKASATTLCSAFRRRRRRIVPSSSTPTPSVPPSSISARFGKKGQPSSVFTWRGSVSTGTLRLSSSTARRKTRTSAPMSI